MQSSQISGLRCMRIILRDMSKCLYCSNILFIVQGMPLPGKENMIDFGQKGKKNGRSFRFAQNVRCGATALLCLRPATLARLAALAGPCNPCTLAGPWASCGSLVLAVLRPIWRLRPALTGTPFASHSPALCAALLASRCGLALTLVTIQQLQKRCNTFFEIFLKFFCNFLLKIFTLFGHKIIHCDYH